jgi:hypothetical protein
LLCKNYGGSNGTRVELHNLKQYNYLCHSTRNARWECSYPSVNPLILRCLTIKAFYQKSWWMRGKSFNSQRTCVGNWLLYVPMMSPLSPYFSPYFICFFVSDKCPISYKELIVQFVQYRQYSYYVKKLRKPRNSLTSLLNMVYSSCPYQR